MIRESICEARRAAGLSQGQLCAILDIPQSHLSNWETGVKTPNLENFDKLLKACNFESEILLKKLKEEEEKR